MKARAKGKNGTKKAAVSGKAARRTDARTRRTRNSLADALVKLMHEKPFAEITVQNVLDEARVGRSTFYAHYQDKDDLFFTDVDEFFERVSKAAKQRNDGRVLPVRELFAHIGEVRDFYAALAASGKMEEVNELAREHFARAIEAHLAAANRGTAIRRRAAAKGLAGALMAMLRWWVETRTPCSPAEMDEVFHRLVKGAL